MRFETLENLCTSIVDCPHSTPDWKTCGVPVIRNFNLKNGLIDTTELSFVDEQTYINRIKRAIPESGDIVISREAPMGNVGLIPDDFKCCLGQRLVLLKVNQDKCPSEYLLYALMSNFVQTQIKRVDSTGSIVSNLNIPDLKKLIIPVFDNTTELNIAYVLSNIDNKIANNNAINAELEALAKTIYDYWFLQFEFPNEEGLPYKSSGGRMVWSEELKREIPEGWECVEFQEICDVRRGASPRPIDAFMDPTNTGMPWVKISDATCTDSPFMTVVKECIIRDGVSKSVEVHPGMLIVSNSATPGIPKFIEIDACVHDGWLVLDNYEEEYKYYLYYVVKMIRNSLLNIASGSIFKNLKTDYLKEYNCIKPDGHTLKLYDEKVRIIMEKILLLQKENEELSSLRDFLLPLLMNGQVGFKDTE